ncbi:MAG: ornithine cyclodeaminase family protein [Candidatus Acidiferrales bacterium]
MALLLKESDVRRLLTMEMAFSAVEESFQHLADGTAILHSRHRLHVPGGSYLHYMAAADVRGGYMGMKIYTSSRQGLRFLVPLFNAVSGELLALIEADYLGQMRTGAASGVATRLMARDDSTKVGLIGTGLQARTQLQAIAQVRKIEHIRVFGRDATRRAKFATEMAQQLNIPVDPVDSAEAAVRGADIIVTSTTASQPVLHGQWLRPGVHINAIGANFPQKRELDENAVLRANIIAVDSREQAKLEAGDLIQPFENDPSRWDSVKELSEIAAGRTPGRAHPDDITLFKSSGIAIEDVVTANRVYEKAIEMKIGQQVPLWKNEEEFDQRPPRP